MRGLSGHVSGALVPPEVASRRQFLQRIALLCVAAAVTPIDVALASARNVGSLKARTAAQLGRIGRGLDPKTMAACRKAAGNLTPHAMALLTGPDWEAQTIKAVVDELKKARAYPDRRPPLDGACAKEEADRLRSEAGSRNPTSPAVATSLGVAKAVTLPYVGDVIAAVLMVIAAVVVLIGPSIASAPEDPAATKKKRAETKESEKEAAVRLRKLQESLVVKLEGVDDCDGFGKRVR